MKKNRLVVIFLLLAGAMLSACKSQSAPVEKAPAAEPEPPPVSRDARTDSDAVGNLALQNLSGAEMSVYIDSAYERTVPAGQTVLINVPVTGQDGTAKSIALRKSESFVTNADFQSPLSGESGVYMSFPMSLKPATRTAPFPVVIWRLPDEAAPGRLNSVLVEFSYPKEDARLNVNAEISTDRNAAPIVSLSQNETIIVPLQPKFTPISVNYKYRKTNGGEQGAQSYPRWDNEAQRNDGRFNLVLRADAPYTTYNIPAMNEIWQISWVPVESRIGTVKVQNASSFIIDLYASTRGISDERKIQEAAMSVVAGWETLKIGETGVYRFTPGGYTLRATRAGSRTLISNIDDITVDPGMIYFWYVQERGSEQQSMDVQADLDAIIRRWVITTSESAAVRCRISYSGENGWITDPFTLGTTNAQGLLTPATFSLGRMVTNLNIDEVKKMALTVFVEKQGYIGMSQSVGLYTLLQAGSSFKFDNFELTKINDQTDPNLQLLIGDVIPR